MQDGKQLIPARVVGNSNSIARGGYTDVVCKHYGNLSNYSLGSSSIPLLGFRVEAVTRERGGFVIIDTAVIDQSAHQRFGTDEAIHAAVFETFLAACAAQDIVPVVLIMPFAWQTAHNSKMHRLFASYGERFGVPIFDGFRWAERIAHLRPELTPDLHVGAAHIVLHLARALGRSFSRGIDRFLDEATSRTVPTESAFRFATADVAHGLPIERTVLRSSALTRGTFAILKPGDEVRVQSPVDSDLIALVVNCSGCSTAIAIQTSAGRIVKDLRNARGATAGAEVCYLFAMVWRLATPLRCPDGEVRIRCLSYEELAAEPVVEANEMGGTAPSVEARAEIDSLVFLVPTGGGERRAYSGELDLVGALSDDEILFDVAAEPPKDVLAAVESGVMKMVEPQMTAPITLAPETWKDQLVSPPGPVRVLGNSNSLIRGGYTEILRVAYGPIINLSLGSSSIPLLGLRAEEMTKERGGIAIVDLAVIDHVTNRSVPADMEAHATIFETFLATCAQADITPIVLIMPSAWASARNALSHQTLANYRDRFGVPTFDGFRYIERLCELRPDLTREAHVDSAHLAFHLARALGRSLVRGIEMVRSTSKQVRWPTERALSFGRIDLASIAAHHQVRTRSTTLLTGTFAALGEGDAITAEIPTGSEIIGLSVNAVRCLTAVVIETSAGRVVKDLRNPRSDPSENPKAHLILVAWKLSSPLPCPDGVVRLSCLSHEDLAREPYVEPNDNGDCTRLTGSGVEIDTLIFLQPDRLDERTSFDGPIDLVAALSDEDIREDVACESVPGKRITGGDGVLVTIPEGFSFREDDRGRMVIAAPGWHYVEDPDGGLMAVEKGTKMPHVRTGRDGVAVEIPEGATVREGKDGRAVTIPAGHSFREGPDGRMVAIAPGETIRFGKDGRAVAISPGESFRQGTDGRAIAIPKGWTFREGQDGRLVAIPPGHSFRQTKEGRLYPVERAVDA